MNCPYCLEPAGAGHRPGCLEEEEEARLKRPVVENRHLPQWYRRQLEGQFLAPKLNTSA